jgi:hypothetical protein
MPSSQSDLLSAASLLLTAVGLLYGTWHGTLTEALAREIPKHRPDRGPLLAVLQEAFWRRSMPLAAFASVTSLILLPDALQHTVTSARAYAVGDANLRTYDPLSTLSVVVELFLLAFSMHLINIARALASKLRQVAS